MVSVSVLVRSKAWRHCVRNLFLFQFQLWVQLGVVLTYTASSVMDNKNICGEEMERETGRENWRDRGTETQKEIERQRKRGGEERQRETET